MIRAKNSVFLVFVALVPVLSGCAQAGRQLAHFQDLFNPPINLTEYNYGAADVLASESKSHVTLNTPIMIGALQPVNLAPGEKIPPFGKVSADQIGGRLTQLGYDVRDQSLGVAESMSMSERAHLDRARDSGAEAVITGSYTISTYDILVNLRLTRVTDGRVLAATDYRLPLGSDTYKLIGRDPFFSVPAPKNNPDARVTGAPLATHRSPVDILPLN